MNVRSTQSQSDLYMFICLRNLVVGVQLHHDQFEDLQNGTVVLICQTHSRFVVSARSAGLV